MHCSLFSSPLKRARTTSEIMWQGREGPINYIESLKEAPLGWLQGMTNGTDAAMSLKTAQLFEPCTYDAHHWLCLCQPAATCTLTLELRTDLSCA